MSFSSSVKNELCRNDTSRKCCLLAEFAAVLLINGNVKLSSQNSSIKIVTENASFARRIFSGIRSLFDIHPEIIIRKNNKLKKHVSYIIVITAFNGAGKVMDSVFDSFGAKDNEVAVKPGIHKNSCCRKAFLRGAFLSGGSVSDPEKTYHLEITVHDSRQAVEISSVINHYGLKTKTIKRKSNFVVYLKEGENIVDFLNIVGAHKALMELENVRILKGMRNNVNRIVNCETANLEKTISASLRQIENIEYIIESQQFDSLPDNLKEVAELRLKYKDANLIELGEMLSPPLGKSGVNHRLRKLDQIAEKLKERKENYNG